MNLSDILQVQINNSGLGRSTQQIMAAVSPFLQHGKAATWQNLLQNLPPKQARQWQFDCDTVTIGNRDELSASEQESLLNVLNGLKPWRKGPFNIFGIEIDTEWRSDWKWNRFAHQLGPLTDQTVLDVGCGSGYHCFRMSGAGARQVVGVEPGLLFNIQFQAIRHFVPNIPITLIPCTLEEFPARDGMFNTVFSMGVIYHRRSPLEHIAQLKECLTKNGTLVMESIVIPGDEQSVLTPKDRYARMSNVWFIPSSKALMRWLERCGFCDIQLIHEGPTTTDEQRVTSWTGNQSLVHSLDQSRPNLTVEGYPAPRRAVIFAGKN